MNSIPKQSARYVPIFAAVLSIAIPILLGSATVPLTAVPM